MKYIVIELQTNVDGTVGNLVYSYDTKAEAESKYYLILSAASVSALLVHAAVMFDSTGFVYKQACYEHPVAE